MHTERTFGRHENPRKVHTERGLVAGVCHALIYGCRVPGASYLAEYLQPALLGTGLRRICTCTVLHEPLLLANGQPSQPTSLPPTPVCACAPGRVSIRAHTRRARTHTRPPERPCSRRPTVTSERRKFKGLGSVPSHEHAASHVQPRTRPAMPALHALQHPRPTSHTPHHTLPTAMRPTRGTGGLAGKSVASVARSCSAVGAGTRHTGCERDDSWCDACV